MLVSHDLTQSGSPLLLVETAVRLRQAGADVELVTLAGDAADDSLPARHGLPVLPVQDSFARCASADLVIANTVETAGWIFEYLRERPRSGRTLVWWIHEIDTHHYAGRVPAFTPVKALIFDSRASLDAWTATGLRFPSVARVIHPGVDDGLVARAQELHAPRRRWARRLSGAMGAARRLYSGRRVAPPAPAGAGASDRVGIRRRLGVEPDDFVLTLVGSYQHGKGQAMLAKTVGRMLEEEPSLLLKLLLIGFAAPAQVQEFLATADATTRRALDPRRLVTVVKDLAPYYGVTDAYVMNSQGAGENFGRVTIEAMTFRLPVLGTNAGGTPEIVEDRVTGLLHPVGADGQAQLAANIRRLAGNRRTGVAMGAAGYRRARARFSQQRFDADLERLLRELLRDGS